MTTKRIMWTGFALLALGATLTHTVAAQQSAILDGRAVMEAVYNRPVGDDMRAQLTMTLTNSRGSQRVRSIQQYSQQNADGEKKIMFFTAPADVRDTSFMTWSWDDGRPDDQWIYLPALRRVQRISADSKNDSFMGSDFTYDDLGERHPDADRHRIVRRESINGNATIVVESIPVDSGAAFGKTLTWVLDGEWIGLRREYYNRSGVLYKTLEVQDFRREAGVWVITRMTMSDHGRNHSTTIELSDVQLNSGLTDDLFSERSMTRGVRR